MFSNKCSWEGSSFGEALIMGRSEDDKITDPVDRGEVTEMCMAIS